MNTSVLLLMLVLVGLSVASMPPRRPDQVGQGNQDMREEHQKPEDVISHRDVEMIDISRALEKARELMTEEEQDLLDDMLEASVRE